jgi:imidazolonepropionase-like amidohydrolase
MNRAVLLAAALLATAAPAAAETVAITHAHILSMGAPGEIASGTVLIRDNVIAAVGAAVAVPANARILDARGQIVTPGLIETNTPLSTVEVAGVESTNDNSTASERLSAAFDVQYGVNPESMMIPIARLGGVTRAVVTPTIERPRRELIFAGHAAVIHLGAGPELVQRPKAGMVLALGEAGARDAGGSRAAEFVLLRAIFQDVREFAANRAAYNRNQMRQMNLSREDLEALIPVVEGREPLMVSAHRAADIHQILKLAREEKLRLILEGAEEAWRVAPEIAGARVPVILNAGADLPESFETLGSTLENAARLQSAGVLIAIENPPLFEGGRTPRFDAGRAVAHGLPFGAALAAITVNPARIWGVADRIGSLEPGKDADLVVWSGDPLETASAPTAVFIRGQQMTLRSRDLDLRDRYLHANDGRSPAYH